MINIKLFGKSIRIGKNPNQIDMFATAGTEREFAPGDKRRLELTSGGKLRWKNADEEGDGKLQSAKGGESGKPKGTYKLPKLNKKQKQIIDEVFGSEAEEGIAKFIDDIVDLYPFPSYRKYDDDVLKVIGASKEKDNYFYEINNEGNIYLKHTGAFPAKVEDVARYWGEKAAENWAEATKPKEKKQRKSKEIDNDKIAELYRNSPISFQVDKMSNKAQEIYNNAGNQAEKQVAHDLWTLGNSIQEEFVAKYVKGEKISTEDVMEVKRIANEMIKGAEEEFEKIKNSGKAKVTMGKKKIEVKFAPEPEEYRIQKFINPVLNQVSYTLLGRNPRTERWDVQYADQEPEYFKELMRVNHKIDLDKTEVEEFEFVPKEKKFIKKTDGIKTISNGKLTKETSLISELPFTASLKKDLEGYGEKTKNILLEGTYQPFADWFKKQYPDQEFKIGKYQDGEPFIAVNGGGEVRYSAYQKDNTGKEIKLSKLKKRKEFLEDRLYSEKLKNNKKVANIGFGTNMRGYQKTKQLSFSREDELTQKIKDINEEIKDLLPKNVSDSNKSIFKNLFKAFGKQISMFGAQPYQKEGQTKEGRGGTLKLTRDSSGKGAHWRLASKQNPNDNSPKANQIPKEENKMGGKVITPANAFELLQDKIGNSVLLQDNEGNLLGEGALQLVNENSEGNYSLFVKEANGFDSVVPIPKNQAVIQKGDEINFKFADKKIVISAKEKSKIPSKPIEMEKAEENAKHARNLEKMRNYNEWQKKADGYAKLANGQKDWFFGDLEIAADAEGLHLGVKDRIIKKSDVLFKEIRRNATRDDKPEIFSALIGALEVKSTAKAKAFLSQLKKKGYEIDIHQLNTLDSKENFFTRVKISKGENDPLPKELQFATGEYAKAFDECAKKPNPLRETEMSLGLKIAAEAVPEFNTIKKQLFNKAGEGLGQLWVTGGLPGSGKSSTLGGEFYKNKVLIDPDGIKYLLAEQRGITKEEVDKKPWELHEESSNIAKHLVREAIREKKDVIYDVTMKGTENLNDLLYMVNSDTFQANAEFIHLPIEKGIERDKMRGEKGGRSIGADLYKKLFGDYPTHKAFFQLKDNFDSFGVYDNSAPLGEGAKLFYIKNDGQEKVLHPEIHEEFKKYGLRQMGKSLYLKYQRRKLLKALETEPQAADSAIGGGNPQELPTSEKIKLLLGFKEQGIDRDIDPEQDFFALGMLKMHGLIDENMNLTPEGEQKYQEQFGSKFSNMNGEENDIEKVIKPVKNIADEKTDEG